MASETLRSPTTDEIEPKFALYNGGCHCGKVEFSVKLSPPLEDQQLVSCNCSICHINAYLMVYPLESDIDWKSGKDELVVYKYGPEKVSYHFCPTCGSSIGTKSSNPDFADRRALNVRIFRGVDLDKMKLLHIDSRETITPGFEYDPSKYPSNPYGSKIA